MRLPIESIKAAILNPDQSVREEAVYYFAKSFSPDPGIMPLAIQAIERYGSKAFETYAFIKDLVQTDETLGWMIREIDRVGSGDDDAQAHYAKSLASAVHFADPKLLVRHIDSIQALNRLDSLSQELIANRITMHSIQPEALWRRLREFCKELEGLDELTEGDVDYASALVDALSRHAGEITEQTLAIVRDQSLAPADVLHIMAVRLVGLLRLEVAIPQLVSWITLMLRCICDRVIARGLLDTLSPYWEEQFLDCSHGFRPGRGVLTFLALLVQTIEDEQRFVLAVDDVRAAFDNLHIATALDLFAEQVTDAGLLSLVETVLRGGDTGRTVGVDQGSALSGLALNMALHWHVDLHTTADAGFPPRLRYADNMVYCC